jgi:hypothetical protein
VKLLELNSQPGLSWEPRISACTMPPVTLLDAAERRGLWVMVGLSAEQYVGYLADPKDAPDVERLLRQKVRSVAGHPALLCYALGNGGPSCATSWSPAASERELEPWGRHPAAMRTRSIQWSKLGFGDTVG